MNNRIFAERMKNGVLWQVVQQNTVTNERYIVKDKLQEQEARDFASDMQRAIENDDNKTSIVFLGNGCRTIQWT